MICKLTGMHVNTMIIYTAMAVKCARYKLPFTVSNADIFSFGLSTVGWTEQLTYAIPHQINMDYSEFTPDGRKLCVRHENHLEFNVKERVRLDRFIKE